MGDERLGMSQRVRILALPESAKERRASVSRVGLALGVSLSEAARLVDALPVALPKRMEAETAGVLMDALSAAGATVELVNVPPGRVIPCTSHPNLEAGFQCENCSEMLCEVCRGMANAASVCAGCRAKRSRSKRFYRIRVAVLLAVLGFVCLYAWADIRSRQARTTWERPVSVAVVLLEMGRVSPQVVSEFKARAGALEDQLANERRRHRPGGSRPFSLSVFGPVSIAMRPPEPKSNELTALARHAFDEWSYLRDVHGRMNGFDAAGYDSRIYVVIKPARGGAQFVEGRSQQGGRIGVVDVDLNSEMVDFAWCVVAHELMHTLGASDKYSSSGQALVPQGLAEPDKRPRFPQSHVEIMARNRPLGSGRETQPEKLTELRVNRYTATEIGWLSAR